MCVRAYGPRFLWMWPNARISVMGGEQAAMVLSQLRRDNIEAKGGTWSGAEEDAFRAPTRAQFETQGHPYYAPRPMRPSSRRGSAFSGCDDGEACTIPAVSHAPDRQSRRDCRPCHPD